MDSGTSAGGTARAAASPISTASTSPDRTRAVVKARAPLSRMPVSRRLSRRISDLESERRSSSTRSTVCPSSAAATAYVSVRKGQAPRRPGAAGSSSSASAAHSRRTVFSTSESATVSTGVWM